jgi:hypothetical protein
MKPDDLDRILLSEKPIAPSLSFEASVMSRIQTEASPCFQTPFPWIPITLTKLSAVILVILLWRVDPGLNALYQLSHTISEWISAPSNAALRNAIQSALASLLGTLMIIWLSLRLTGANR